jgi:hypothetical protein
MEVAMKDLHGRARLWIAIVSLCTGAGWLAGCSDMNGTAGEGSSSPPSQSAIYVYPPANLQVYD